MMPSSGSRRITRSSPRAIVSTPIQSRTGQTNAIQPQFIKPSTIHSDQSGQVTAAKQIIDNRGVKSGNYQLSEHASLSESNNNTTTYAPLLDLESYFSHQEHIRRIVQAGIDSADNQSARKRSFNEFKSDFEKAPQPVTKAIPQKKNAFAALMTGAKKQKEMRLDVPRHFENWREFFTKDLAQRERNVRINDEAARGKIIAESIATSVKTIFLPCVHASRQKIPHIETKINALHALIEISSAVAYAPKGQASDIVRHGNIPRFLTMTMYGIVKDMTPLEIKQVGSEGGFIGKVKGLRQNALVEGEGDTWNRLDDVLRILRDPGPVDFKLCFADFKHSISHEKISSTQKGSILKIIQDDFLAYVHRDSCFETKYNAMNALSDLALSLMGTFDSFSSTVESILLPTIKALAKNSRMLDTKEIERIIAELQSEPKMASPKFLDDLQMYLSPYLNYNSSSDMTLLEWVRTVKDVLDTKKSERSSMYCGKGLLAKFLYLRWSKPCSTFSSFDEWSPRWNDLDDMLVLFMDKSIPLKHHPFLGKVEASLREVQIAGTYERQASLASLRTCMDHIIARISSRATEPTSSRVKVSALIVLTKIGLQMLDFLSLTRPEYQDWQLDIFKDHITEDLLTDAMLTVCHLLVRTGEKEALTDNEFLDYMKKLDTERAKFPEALEGLDAVLDLIGNPTFTVYAAKRAMLAKPKLVIDLTDD